MDSWCKGSEERVRWQRRIRSHQSPDANSDPGAHAGTDTDSEPYANSGAIGITESDSEPIDDTVGDSDAEHDVGTKPIDDTVGNTGADTHACDTDSEPIGTHAVGDSVDSSSAHTDSDPEHAAPAVPTAGNRRHQEQCDR